MRNLDHSATNGSVSETKETLVSRLHYRGGQLMKKLFQIILMAILLVGSLGTVPENALAVTAAQYCFKAGDLVCVRATANIYRNSNGKWSQTNDGSQYFGKLKETKKVKVPTSKGKRAVRLYSVEVDTNYSAVWADDIAPAVMVGDQVITYDALKGYMSVDLTTSSVRQAVLENGLEVAQALQEAQKKLGYGKYFKVKVEYFAWELIAHAYAAEFGLPDYTRSSIADCDVSQTDEDTEFIIDVAWLLWRKGPSRTWV